MPLPNVATTNVITWIMAQPFFINNQAPNFAVGLSGDTMIISKVGGITLRAGGMAALQAQIQTYPWYVAGTTVVYLAKKFTSDGASNHGEMCVLAAADDLGLVLNRMECTGANCAACFQTLGAYGVPTVNVMAAGSQVGWAHPRGRLAMGTAVNDRWDDQVAELPGYNALATTAARNAFAHQHTMRTLSMPQGDWEQII
ncbi:hypothetical protein F4553_006796 [Allocatelliglobosispora scoriae]|uniref:Uncharacterized protein n=1 Tax=Allocatelliglobosispora scoriae TaxID=643052 RepID=A0A841C2U1_9ACTN|nr:hypothetical protein [Allocatelliglobosispora scoriae]MBB5873362.1 hypothetical protein [Allocatelliglobosispora scoriae]